MILLSLSSLRIELQVDTHRHTQCLMWVLWVWTRVLTFAQQVLNPLSYFSSPSSPLLDRVFISSCLELGVAENDFEILSTMLSLFNVGDWGQGSLHASKHLTDWATFPSPYTYKSYILRPFGKCPPPTLIQSLEITDSLSHSLIVLYWDWVQDLMLEKCSESGDNPQWLWTLPTLPDGLGLLVNTRTEAHRHL